MQETVGDKIVSWIVGGGMLSLAAFFVWPVFDRMSGETTAYRAFCASERKGDKACPLKDEAASITETFKAFPDQQSVITWIGDGAPSKLSDCAVRDVLNWRCTSRDSFGVVVETTMMNGQLSETIDGQPSPSFRMFYQTARWRWWLVTVWEKSGLR